MKNLNFFEKLWEHSRTLRRVGLVLVMCLITITQMWAYEAHFYLIGSWNSWSATNKSYKLDYDDGYSAYSIYWYLNTDTYFALNNGSTRYNPTTTTNIYPGHGGTTGKYTSDDGGCGDCSWKYTGNPGIVKIHVDENSSDKEWRPWVWVSRPTVYVRHRWNNDSWSNQAMTDNNDGTYTYIGQYSGSNQTNVGPCESCSMGGDYFKYFSSATLTGSPAKGDRCLFTYNSSGFRGKGGDGSNKGSLTITKLCSITYDGNGKTGGAVPTSQTDIVYNTSTTVSGNVGSLVKTGCAFIGWNTAKDGTGKFYLPGSSFTPTATSHTLYAQWLQLHEPGVYESSEGYNKSLKTYSGREYEIYRYTETSSVISIFAGETSTTTKGDKHCVAQFAMDASSNAKFGGWIMHNGGISNKTSKASDNSAEFSAVTGAKGIKGWGGQGYFIYVSGYDQFDLWAQDKNLASNYYIKVYRDGEDVTAYKDINQTVRPYTLDPSLSYLIRIECLGNQDSNGDWLVGFSLRLPPSSCTAPSALAAASPTANGITLSVTDANDVNNYEFYVSTESTAPEAGATATHSVSSAKSLTITNLVAGTTYYAWARTKCSASNKSDWVALGDGGTFTTSTVTVTHTLTNVTKTSGATTAGGSDYMAEFAAVSGYSMPTPTVTIDGNTATSGTDYTWNAGTGTITIPANKINGNIVITMNSAATAPSSVSITGNYHIYPGETLELTATPTGGNGPKTYQWQKYMGSTWTNLAGETSNIYTKASVTTSDVGHYRCIVTCGGTASTTSGQFDVKCLQLYVYYNNTAIDLTNSAFTNVDATHAYASVLLGNSTYCYHFKVTDGCGNWWGNNGESGMSMSNHDNWPLDGNYYTKLWTSKAGTYRFNLEYNAGLTSYTMSVVYPSGTQAAGYSLYFANEETQWNGSKIYYRVGKKSHNNFLQMTLVSGTANLYKVTTTEYGGFEAWHIANNRCGGNSTSIYKTNTDDAYEASAAMMFNGTDIPSSGWTVIPDMSNHWAGTDDAAGCEFYGYNTVDGMKTDRVTINDYSGGTITVNYTNTSGSAATLTSGYADLAHTVILTSITAVADEGYDASAITINGGAYSTNYVVTGNTTIAASFTLKTYTISYNKGTNGTGSKASETKTHGVNFTLPGSTFTYGGHAQDGWSTSDGGALAYALSGSYTTNAAQEFFPHWKCNTPTITDNGDNTVSITVPSGTTVRYTTDGTDPSSSTGTVYSTTFSIAADCTVKAIAYQSNCTDSEIASQACDYTAPANFQMIATTSGSDATLTHNESISASSKNCATLTGGTAKYVDEDASQKMTVKSGESYGWNFNRNKDQIVITLSGHVLQEGSVITVSGYANADLAGFKMNGVTIFSKTSGSGSFADQSYTVLSTDEALINKNVLTLTRNSGSGAYLHSITISNCASGTPCVTPVLPSLTTPNQACTTGDFAAWDASVTNSAAISAASGSQAVSYSWKNSSSVEVATTASYTPSAAGTYTVTATVHSDASGYIDATATSSTLTASLYTATSIGTQPTTAVAAEEGENFTLGTGMVATGQGDLSYQWYSYTSSGGAGEASIGSATSATYTTSKAAAGTYYYKVKVTADCGTVASNMITVTVTEAPCFKASDLKKAASGWTNLASGATLDASTVIGTITGGTITNSGTDAIGANNSGGNGLVIEGSKEITVTLSGSHVLGSSSVITLTCAGNNTTSSHTSGFAISGLAMDPATEGPSTTSCNTFAQTFEVSGTVLEGSKSFKIALADGTSKTYLRSITVTGCEDCTPIDPELSYSKTTIWMDDADLTATPSLDKDGSTGTVSYALTSATPSGCVTLNTTTGVVTAVKRGTATITATIEADGTHCGKSVSSVITVKDMTCGWTVIAGVTATSKNSGTPEGSLIASSSGYKVNLQDWASPDGGCGTGGKIGSDNNYIYLTLKSGEYFQDGDKVIVDIAKVPGTGDSKLHIYDGTTTLSDERTMIGTSGTPTCGENEIVLSGVPANTSSITLHRGNGPTSATIQNPYVISMKVKRYVCPDSKEFLPTASSGNWNATANWIGSDGRGASLPTIDDRVVISKPVTVDIADAKAKDVLVNQYSGATGKITVSAGKALIIAEKMQKTTTGSNRIATAAADVIINSTRAAGVGALVIGGETGANQATVNFATKAKNDGGWVNQFIGSPFSDNEPYVDYALQLYKFVPRANGDRGWWSTVHEGDEMEEFWGYNVLYNDASELDVTWTGTLNASESKTISGLYYNGSSETDNMFANSWTAPIHVGAIEDADLPNASKTLYMFNAGTPAQEEGQNGSNAANNNSDPGTYISIPIHSAPYAGIGVIPSMQAFYVEATSSGASITLDYNKIVYTPALTSVGIVPNRAPKHNAEVVEPEVIKLHVQSETGWGANTYVLGRADFAEGYEDGWDGAYIEGESATPKLYTPSIDGNMFINCLPEIEGTVVGFRKGSSDNNYIFSFDYDGDEVWYLNDQKAQKSTQIMNGQTYAFVSEAGDNAARFVISATPINKIATGCESVGAEAAKVRKLIINDKVYIIRGGQVFDVLGKTIKK